MLLQQRDNFRMITAQIKCCLAQRKAWHCTRQHAWEAEGDEAAIEEPSVCLIWIGSRLEQCAGALIMTILGS